MTHERSPRIKKRPQDPPLQLASNPDEVDQASDPELVPSPSLCYSRPTELSDLLRAEIESLKEPRISIDTLVTRCHRNFNIIGRQQNTAGERSSTQPRYGQYEVGTAVSVRPTSSSSSSPRIAVILGIWTIYGPGFEGNGRVRVSLCWLHRPSDLTGAWAKVTHLENEVYLSQELPTVVAADDIISRCTVESTSENTRLRPPGSPRSDFYCGFSVDLERQSFSAIDWDEFLETLKRHPPDLPSGKKKQPISQTDAADVALGGQRKRARISSEGVGEVERPEQSQHLYRPRFLPTARPKRK